MNDINNIIDIEHVSFHYNAERPVLKDVSLSIKEGEFVGIIGHNGSGKSTLAKLLVGLEIPNEGVIKIKGQVFNEESYNALHDSLGIVFQNPDNQFVGTTVRDDIAFGLENRQIDQPTMEKMVEEYAAKVSMTQYLDHNPEQLSGGEKQRVAIAGVLAINPDIIIFDEATSMLDPVGQREVNEIIRTIKGKKTMLFITHSIKEVFDADRIVVMDKGQIVLNGKPEEVFKENEILKRCRLATIPALELAYALKDESLKRKAEVEDALWDIAFQK